MLMQGLRSAEVMALNRDDVLLSRGQLRYEQGEQATLAALWQPETRKLLDHYLRVERPDPCRAALFVVLKGPARGQRMTPAGLRSLFRHHRRTTGVQLANPTGSDTPSPRICVPPGISSARADAVDGPRRHPRPHALM